jgi:Fe-S-cluster containining protein
MDYNCVECGACCASFRVDFHPSDGEAQGGRVPESLYDELNVSIARMRGTDDAQPRCRALRGRIGEQVSCFIYDERPDPCREFEAGSEACLRARRRHGLAEVA